MPDDNDKVDLKSKWDKRAQEKKDKCNSVLFQGLPDSLNAYIHEFHWHIIKNQLLPSLTSNAIVLDLGCGYGRIGKLITDNRKDIELISMDFSFTYCTLCKKNTRGNVICADILRLPFRARTYNAIVAVTSMMYIPLEKRKELMNNLVNLLQPGGKIIMIEPSDEYLKLISRIKPSSKNKTTGGDGFTMSEFLEMGKSIQLQIVNYGGLPVFSLILPLLYYIDKLPRILKIILTIIRTLDNKISRFCRFSIHRWMLVDYREEVN